MSSENTAPEVATPEVETPEVETPEVKAAEVTINVSDLTESLVPVMVKQDVTEQAKAAKDNVTSTEKLIRENGVKLGKLYEDGKYEDADKLQSENAKLVIKRNKLASESDAIDVEKLESLKKVRGDYVPSVTGMANAIDSLREKLETQRETRQTLIDSGEIDDAIIKAYHTDIAVINSKLGKRPRKADGTSTRKNGEYVNEDGSASWTAADEERNATADQVTEMRKVYTDATERSESRPIKFVMAYLIGENIIRSEKHPVTERSDTDSNWTPVASIVGHNSK